MKKLEYKYYNYQYVDEIKELLGVEINKVNENRLKSIEEDFDFKNIDRAYSFIIRDLFILYYINNFSTSQLAIVYNIGIRSIQLWLKELEMTNIKTPMRKKKKNSMIISPNNINKTFINIIQKEEKISMGGNKDFAIYRLLDKDKNILYIGKCIRTKTSSNGHGGLKEYFLKDRIAQHYSPSSKQNPKSLYLNVIYIEATYPKVNNNKDLEKIESSLIFYYERNFLSCNYNRDIGEYEEINNDTNIWEEIAFFSDKDIDKLRVKYNFDDIPSIEITNERLQAMMWILNKLKYTTKEGLI